MNPTPFVAFAIVACCVAQPPRCADDDEIVVRFRLHAPDLAENTKVYIAGKVPQLGNWKPDQVPMEYTGEQTWAFDLSLTKPQTVEYKYTLGSWAREGANADGRPLNNFIVDVKESTEQRDQISFWTTRPPPRPQGQITGQVKYHRRMSGEGIRPRDVIVWLPPGYEMSESRFPVLYMHDGQNIIDPMTSAFGVDWEVDETCTRLITAKQLEPMIVVGIYNTPDRSREYLPGATGDAYRRFIVDSLKPFIDKHYRTMPSRDHTYTAGSSAGGLCAFMLTWEHSDVFSKAICMSPAFRMKNAEGAITLDYVTPVESMDRPAAPIFLYIDNGGVGLEKLLQPGIDDMLETLKEKGFEPERDLVWFHAPEDQHSESAWAKRFPSAIRRLAPDAESGRLKNE